MLCMRERLCGDNRVAVGAGWGSLHATAGSDSGAHQLAVGMATIGMAARAVELLVTDHPTGHGSAFDASCNSVANRTQKQRARCHSSVWTLDGNGAKYRLGTSHTMFKFTLKI